MSDRKNITAFPEIREPLLKQISSKGKNRRQLPEPFACALPADIKAGDVPDLPDVAEIESVRHFTRLSRLNFGLDHGLYPLGSCTMKYNPKITEVIAGRLSQIHPADSQNMQPVYRIIKELEGHLNEICGMSASCLWPAAGAHGELAGIMAIKQAVEARGEKRSKILIPDTAHGTNPASCTIAGFESVNIPSGPEGYLKAETLKDYLNDDVAGMMITNPNTLGIFEQEIKEIADALHLNGSFLYMDGANMNAIMGIARPGDLGVDCMHLNLHKTFATPHGGGGPGAGPVLVNDSLAPYLPNPRIVEHDGVYSLSYDNQESLGQVHTLMGNVSVLLKTYSYILSLGPEGIREAAELAGLNANYLKARLKKFFDLPYETPTLHEFVFTDKNQEASTMDMAKALMEYGFHPPTVYFPLVVSGALMIEPTETEPFEELDRFATALEAISKMSAAELHEMPQNTPVGRVDEVNAARKLVLSWHESII